MELPIRAQVGDSPKRIAESILPREERAQLDRRGVGEHQRRSVGWWDAAPLFLLPPLLLLMRTSLHVSAWIFMWLLAGTMYMGCKWLTYRQAKRSSWTASTAATLAYLLAWPGMEAKRFLTGQPTKRPRAGEWIVAGTKIVAGAILVWIVAREYIPAYPILAGWIGMTGVVLLLHFGAFQLCALFWQARGRDARPLMQEPLSASSVADFWGRRWNTAFHALASDFIFRRARRVVTVPVATLLVFFVSGLIHDLVISVPAGAGYGWPTAYFILQGAGVIIERSRAGQAVGLGHGLGGRLYAWVTIGPAAILLFHPAFVRRVILPMLEGVGAIGASL